MIRKENVIINGKEFTHTWSDDGRFVVRDGVAYEVAYDPAELGREYTEGDELPIISADEALSILTGEE